MAYAVVDSIGPVDIVEYVDAPPVIGALAVPSFLQPDGSWGGYPPTHLFVGDNVGIRAGFINNNAVAQKMRITVTIYHPDGSNANVRVVEHLYVAPMGFINQSLNECVAETTQVGVYTAEIVLEADYV